MRNILERELVRTRNELKGLIKGTEFAIGSLANYGFDELNKIPAAKYYPRELPIRSYKFNPDDRFFQARQIIRVTQMPAERIFVQPSLEITQTSTEVFSRKRSPSLAHPVHDRLVTIAFTYPGASELVPSTASVSVNGYANYKGKTDYTYPRALYKVPFSHNYKSPEDLVIDYSNKFSGALSVAKLIGEGLTMVHGIDYDPRQLDTLHANWRSINPQAEKPAIFNLPTPLAREIEK